MRSDQGQDPADAVPRLAPGCDPTELALTPAEGFLLSRIDGSTTWGLLREMGGLAPGEVDECLERWLADGVVVVDGRRAAPARPFPAPAAAPGPAPDLIDPLLDISEEAQEAILAFEARLDGSYHEILGIPPDAETRAVKRAYFALSKEFHPDRYFRREIGPYAKRLDRVFRKIVEAHELLSDPATRAEVERSYADARGGDEGEAGAPRRRARPRPFSLMSRMFAKRRTKAKGFFEAGMAAWAQERWLEAAASVRLAIAFDPTNEVYRGRFGEVQQRANELRAEQLIKEADSALSFRDSKEALGLYEEALHFRPFDAELNHNVAKLAWVVGEDLRRAKEYAARACEAQPDNAGYHRTLGQIYKAAGLEANARRELKTALRLDPNDAEARAELKSLGKR